MGQDARATTTTSRPAGCCDRAPIPYSRTDRRTDRRLAARRGGAGLCPAQKLRQSSVVMSCQLAAVICLMRLRRSMAATAALIVVEPSINPPPMIARLSHQPCNAPCFHYDVCPTFSFTACRVEVCMGVGNPMGIPFPWEFHGNGNSHTAHDGNGNGNGNKANGNGNSIYFTRVKIPKIIVMH